MKRGRIQWLVCAALPLGAIAATTQPLPCDSVSPEAREYVRNRGACSDAKPAPRPRASTRSKSSASGSPASAQQNQLVPHVIGRSFTDAARALAKFKVERIETANAAPAGEVLAQEPAPAALGRPGSTVVLQVSDGSLAGAASTNPSHDARHCGRGLVRADARNEPCARIDGRPFAASRANQSARSTRSFSERIRGHRCAHLRRWRFTRAVVRCNLDASAAATRPSGHWRKRAAAHASSTSAARRSAAGRIRRLRPLRDRRLV